MPRLKAPAKVNLSLRVLGRRGDGHHEVDTTLATVGVNDRLEVSVERRPGVRIEVLDAPDVPADGTNLAARAAAEVLARHPHGGGVGLRLRKEIPTAAGLGGGSSDAAAAAVGTALALGVTSGLERILAAIGADCPFFIGARRTGIARCTGRGEVVAPLPALRDRWVLLVTPDVRADTRQVYAAWRPRDASAEDAGEDAGPSDWSVLPLEAQRAALRNDLEAAALRAVAGLAAWRRLLDECGLTHARLAGSGSSFFALFDRARAAEDAAALVRGRTRRQGMRPRMVRAVPVLTTSLEVLREKRSG